MIEPPKTAKGKKLGKILFKRIQSILNADEMQCNNIFIIVLLMKIFIFLRNISNTRDSVSSGYQNTEKRVENTTRSEVFLTKFEVFG